MIERPKRRESIESEKIELAERILAHYWAQPEPFRKLAEHKRTMPHPPVGDLAWHMLKIYIWFGSESLIPSEERVAADAGLPVEKVRKLFELARAESRKKRS